MGRAPASILAILSVLGAGEAAAQAPRDPLRNGASYEVQVDLVVIDVVVTDRDGNHVVGLAKEDFELYEDGRLQEITDFSEEGLPLTAAAQTRRDVVAVAEPATEDVFEGRWFVLFFDESNMTAADVDRARKAARDFVRYEIFPQDRVAVLRYGNSLKLDQDFTGDVDLLARALYAEGTVGQPLSENMTTGTGTPGIDRVARARSAGMSDTEASDMSTQGDLIRFQDTPDFQRIERSNAADRLYKALGLAGKTLARIRGRKTLVLFSRGFDAVFADHGLFKSYRDMVNTLNGSNVAIYPVDVGGTAGRTPGTAGTGARRNASDPMGTTTDAFRTLAGETLSSLKVLAADTGGVALVGSNDVASQLKKMAYSTSSYYLLGYTPEGRSDGAGFRDVKVKVKRDGTRVLTRKGYNRAADFASLDRAGRKEQLEDALLSWVDIQDLPIALRTEFYPVAPERCVMGVELSLPRGVLQVDEQGARADVMMYLRRETSRGKVESFKEEIPLSREDALKELRYVRTMDLKPGTYWLKVVLRDGVGGSLGTTGARLTIPAFDDDRPIMSTLVLMAPSESTRLVESKEGSETSVMAFRVAGQQFYPSPDNEFPAEGEVVCFFRVNNLKLDEATGLPRVSVMYTVWRDGKPISQQTVHYRADERPDPVQGLPIHVRLPVGQLGGGSYKLEVSTYDVLAAKGMKSEVAFRVAGPPAAPVPPASPAPAAEPESPSLQM